MTTQTVTAQELMSESPSTVEDIIDLILSDTISTLVESDEGYSHLRPLFIQSGEDIVENYKDAIAFIDLSAEYQSLHPLVENIIHNIGADLFVDMLDADEDKAYSEVLRCFGHGVSFWDNYDYKDFGFSEMPQLRTTLEQPYDIATQVLDKIAEAHPELVEDDEEEDRDNVTTYQIPAYLLSYFINGEFAGLDKKEFDLIESFLFVNRIDMSKGHFSYDDGEPYFSGDNDLSNVGCSVVEIQWVNMSNTSTQDNDFDIWLSQNYIPAGEASDGEQWYLSTHPNEFMPFPLSEIKQKWADENNRKLSSCSTSSYDSECLYNNYRSEE